MTEIREIQIREEPIELHKVLKLQNLVASGGEAKLVISGGYVTVNGETETRKSKKIYSQDIVEFNQEKVRVVLGDNTKAESDG